MADGVYPFPDPKPANFADGQRFSHVHANTIKENAAAAADGSLWTDVAMALNWQESITVTNHGYSPLWLPYPNGDGYWYSFGFTGSTPLAAYSFSSGSWITGQAITAGTP